MTALTTDALVEKVAAAMADADLWPGSWQAMPEAERNMWLHRARAGLGVMVEAAEPDDRYEDAGYLFVAADRLEAEAKSFRYSIGPCTTATCCDAVAALLRALAGVSEGGT